MDGNLELSESNDDIKLDLNEDQISFTKDIEENEEETDNIKEAIIDPSKTEVAEYDDDDGKDDFQNQQDTNRTQSDSLAINIESGRLSETFDNHEQNDIIDEESTNITNEGKEQLIEETDESQILANEDLEENQTERKSAEPSDLTSGPLRVNEELRESIEEHHTIISERSVNGNTELGQDDQIEGMEIGEQGENEIDQKIIEKEKRDETKLDGEHDPIISERNINSDRDVDQNDKMEGTDSQIEREEPDLENENEFIGKNGSSEINVDERDKPGEKVETISQKPQTIVQETGNLVSQFFTVHVQLDDGSIRNKIVTIVRNKFKKPFLGGYRHKGTGVEYHNASIQTRPKPRPPPSVELFSRDTQTYQLKHQKVNTCNETSTQMTGPGIYVSNIGDKLISPGKYETADEYRERELKNVIIIQKYYRRWLAKRNVMERRRQRDERREMEQQDREFKQKMKEDRIQREYERRMHPKTRADFDLLYNGLEKWRQDQLTEIERNESSTEAEKKAAKMMLLEEEIDLLAAIDRHKIDRDQESKGEQVQKLLNKAAMPKSWKDNKGRKIEMDTPYTIRCRELLDILNSLNMQYLTQDERLDVLLTLKHTVKEHNCKLTRDIVELVDREADLIIRNVKDNSLAGLRKRIVTLFLQYCKTPTFNPEISLLLKVPPDPSSLVGDINYCKYCGRYLRSTDFSLSAKLSKLTICKSCARKENQSRKRQDYSHYRRILRDLQMDEQQMADGSKTAFIFKQNDVKTLIETVWDSKSILSECEVLDELVFVRWNRKEHWSPWNNILLTKEEAEAHNNVENVSEAYSKVMINRINQKHVMAKIKFESLEKMADKMTVNQIK